MPLRRRAVFLPRPLEAFLLGIYPSILLLGSVFATLDPSARSAPYDFTTRAHPPALAPSYFAHKSNIFNKAFVKVGWFWTTASFLSFLFTYGGPVVLLTPRRLQGLLRYGLVTLWWFVMTRWCFGPALIDRIFLLTGGLCEGHYGVASGAACKARHGVWIGGYDVSGHVFILALGSMFLWMEVLPVRMRAEGGDDRLVMDGLGREDIQSAASERQRKIGPLPIEKTSNVAFSFVVVIQVLWAWMLLMTAAYFHTWFEKVRGGFPSWLGGSKIQADQLIRHAKWTGLVMASICIYTVYYLPRLSPRLRETIGMPGI